MIDKGWCNNIISYRMNAEFDHDFSMCDIDGAVHCLYFSETRLIFYESKHKHEKISPSQLRLLKMLSEGFDFGKYDKYSGVYIFRGEDDNFDKMKAYKIVDGEMRPLKIITINELYSLFSNKIPFKL